MQNYLNKFKDISQKYTDKLKYSNFNIKLDNIGFQIQQQLKIFAYHFPKSQYFRLKIGQIQAFVIYGIYGYVIFCHARITHTDQMDFYDNQLIDRAGISLMKSNKIDLRKAELLNASILEAQKTNNLDTMTWLYFGYVYGFSNYPDISYNAYYMAHLKDHKLIKTNHQLQFDTSSSNLELQNIQKNMDEEIMKKLMNG